MRDSWCRAKKSSWVFIILTVAPKLPSATPWTALGFLLTSLSLTIRKYINFVVDDPNFFFLYYAHTHIHTQHRFFPHTSLKYAFVYIYITQKSVWITLHNNVVKKVDVPSITRYTAVSIIFFLTYRVSNLMSGSQFLVNLYTYRRIFIGKTIVFYSALQYSPDYDVTGCVTQQLTNYRSANFSHDAIRELFFAQTH